MIITNKKAFTLIEMLVVVLIIGVLAAIAFPKYQFAVEKTRAINKLNLVVSLGRPAQAYVLATGKMPSTLDDLDINPPLVINEDNLLLFFNAHGEIELKHIVTSNNGTFYTFYVAIDGKPYRFPRGSVACEPKSSGNSKLAKKICDSLCNGSPYQAASGGVQACSVTYI